MPDFHRGDDWWRHGQNLYLDNMEATGFYRVALTEEMCIRDSVGTPGSLADSRSQASGTFEQNNHVVINNDGTNGQIGPAALKAVYDICLLYTSLTI